MASEVILPTSAAEAIEVFGDGSGVTVLAGGTVVVPEITSGRRKARRVLMLARSGLDVIERSGGTVRIGATTPVAALEGGDEPLATAARHVGDPEIRAQATVGGNLCSGATGETPRGDLQAPLIVLGARVRSVGAGGERNEPVEDFLAGGADGRLVLDVTYDDVERAAGYAAVRRPHTHHYTILAVACAKAAGDARVAVTGGGPHGLRCRSVEAALASGASAAEAAATVVDDVVPRDDALASAWYRRRVLPGLVEQALNALG